MQAMPGRIKNRVDELLAQRRREGRELPKSYRGLSELVGMTPNGVGKWLNNEITRYDEDKLTAWCDLLQCDIGDLLVYEREEARP